jgi:hypothetical protein
MKRIDEAGGAICAAGRLESRRGTSGSWLPGASIFDNLFVRVSAEVGRHSCEKGK